MEAMVIIPEQPRADSPGHEREVDSSAQEAWQTVLRQGTWRTLALVAAHRNHVLRDLVRGLVEAAVMDPKERLLVVFADACTDDERAVDAQSMPCGVVDFNRLRLADEAVGLNRLPALLRTPEAQAYGRILVVFGTVLDRPTLLPAIEACDAAVLCVRLGEAGFNEATRTLKMVGKARFVGSLVDAT